MKKFLIAALLGAMLCTLASGVHALDAPIREYYNSEVKVGIKADTTDSISSDTTYIELALDLTAENSGRLTINGETRGFVLRGLPERVELSDGRVGYIGGLSGELDDGESIAVSLHALPSESKYFIGVTTGTLTVNSDGETQDTLKTYVFGEYFDEIGELVEQYMADKNPATETDEIEKVEVVGGDTGEISIVDIGSDDSDTVSIVDIGSDDSDAVGTVDSGSGDTGANDIGFADIASLDIDGAFQLIPAVCSGGH